jgi:hypothetical protein
MFLAILCPIVRSYFFAIWLLGMPADQRSSIAPHRIDERIARVLEAVYFCGVLRVLVGHRHIHGDTFAVDFHVA